MKEYENIESLIFNVNIERIEDNCFNGASNLSNIYIPNTIKYIGTDAFKGVFNDCAIKINIPAETLSTFTAYPFGLSNGTKIKTSTKQLLI